MLIKVNGTNLSFAFIDISGSQRNHGSGKNNYANRAYGH